MKTDTKKLVTSALMIALGTVISFVCEMIPFFNLPFGGTITICSMLPVIFISFMFGTKWGLFSGFTYAVLQMAVGFRTVSALFLPDSDAYSGIFKAFLIILLDYILAFSSLGLGGVFRKRFKKTTAVILGTVFSLFVCYLFHVLSGVIFYGDWAEWFFTETVISDLQISKNIMEHFSGMGLALIYSVCYNGCYMIPEIIISVIASIPLSKIVPEGK